MKKEGGKIVKRHYKKPLTLDNCTLLKDLRVLIPQELFAFEDEIKREFKNIELFYKKFFSIENFTEGLTVVFHLKSYMAQVGKFCSAGKKDLPEINIFALPKVIFTSELGTTLVHEMAHFIDWKVGKIEKNRDFVSCYNGSRENILAQKFKSFQEVKPVGLPWCGSGGSTYALSQPHELFARYAEEYYAYCFHGESSTLLEKKKNSLYVRKSQFEAELKDDMRNYLENDCEFPYKENLIIDGDEYSSDKKILLRHNQKVGEKDFTVPDFVEVIGRNAFCDCDDLETVDIANVRCVCYGAFSACKKLRSVAGASCLLIIDTFAFLACKNVKQFTGLENVAYIGKFAFSKSVMDVLKSRINVYTYTEEKAFL